jgi:quercetin dioxygenase-like cupin family protein
MSAMRYEPEVKIFEASGLYFRSHTLRHAMDIIPQHVHDHDHATFVAAGRARAWKDGVLVGDRSAGEAFEIEAGAEHIFQALEPKTMLVCVHDLKSAEKLKGI